MSYIYPVVWFLAGLILIFKLSRENKIFIFAGLYFLFLGGWWLTNLLQPQLHMFSGSWGWGLRGVTAVALVVMGVAFYREKKEHPAQDAPRDQGTSLNNENLSSAGSDLGDGAPSDNDTFFDDHTSSGEQSGEDSQ